MTSREHDDAALGGWRIPEGDYPATGTPPERWLFLLRYAVLAPSSHNAQPWRFRIRGDEVGVYGDRTRSLPVVDPDDRELVLACGAALFNLRGAARYFGHAIEVREMPDPADHDLLATVRFSGRRSSTLEEDALFHAMTRRATNRQPFDHRPLAEETLQILEAAARSEGAWLSAVRGNDARHAVAALVAEGDRIQFASRPFRHELADWIHAGRRESQDGMPAYAFGVHQLLDLRSPSLAFVVRTFDIGAGVAARDTQLRRGLRRSASSAPTRTTPSRGSGRGRRSSACSSPHASRRWTRPSSTSPSRCRH